MLITIYGKGDRHRMIYLKPIGLALELIYGSPWILNKKKKKNTQIAIG